MGEQAADGVRWIVKCRACQREVILPPEKLAMMFEPATTEFEARARLKCKRCGTRGENYLSAYTGRSWIPGESKGMKGAYEGIYGRQPRGDA